LPIKESILASTQTLHLQGKILDLSTPLVMGIINVTPDSFYTGSRYQQTDILVKQAESMLLQGATVLDIGGYSSRPGASAISEQEEMDRVLPAIEAIIRTTPGAIISIDTFRSNVARAAVDAGACMVNDISGGELDKHMFDTVSELQVPYILMHMQGNPQTMAKLSTYEDILTDIINYFQKKVYLLRQSGLKDIILDVGFGFAKNIEQNYYLLKNLACFNILNLPLLVGLSRKSLIYKKLGISAEEALNGTTVLHTLALINGASILRVHDVKEACEAVKLFKFYND
jgi:dihydropteroate synthase